MNNDKPIMVSLNMAYDEKDKDIKVKNPVEKDAIISDVADLNQEIELQVMDSTVEPVILPESIQNQIDANLERRVTETATQIKRARANQSKTNSTKAQEVQDRD